MNKATYQKRLEEIIEEAKTGSMLAGSNAVTIQAICLLNDEAIGADEPTMTNEVTTESFRPANRNQLRQELKAVMGTTNG